MASLIRSRTRLGTFTIEKLRWWVLFRIVRHEVKREHSTSFSLHNHSNRLTIATQSVGGIPNARKGLIKLRTEDRFRMVFSFAYSQSGNYASHSKTLDLPVALARAVSLVRLSSEERITTSVTMNKRSVGLIVDFDRHGVHSRPKTTLRQSGCEVFSLFFYPFKLPTNHIKHVVTGI